ncbi:MAG: hypothetical protein Q4C91_03905 [Eubacteriales bacterium]|nr:hypothetical protein [Eubacteriales bacterium]
MKGIRRYLIAVLCAVVLFTGCGKKNMGGETSNEIVNIENEEASNIEEEGFFPASYTGGSDIVKFDCTLEVPAEFDPKNFYLPEITGMQYIDGDAVYRNYVEGEEIKETYNYPSEKEGVPDDNVYIFNDDRTVSVSGVDGFGYYDPEVSRYRQVMRATERGASQEDFEFGTGESCVEQVKEALKNISYPVDEFEFSWFSLSGEEHEKLEQEALRNGVIGEENLQGDWTGKDEYEIYAWQIYDGLPVFPQWMTTSLTRAVESYQKAQVSAVFTSNGMVNLDADPPYIFEKTDKTADFLSFSEIAKAVEERYKKILTDSTYTVNRAKLAVRVYIDENQKYKAEPVWYFEVADNNGGTEILLFNAESGKEIFLN